MSDNWFREDFDEITDWNGRELCLWLRRGLLDWYDTRENWRAFSPLRDRFVLRDDPEPQLAEMFDAMSETLKQKFLESIIIGFKETEPSDKGFAFFDYLLRLTILVDRPEPIEAMVYRLRQSDFLEYADPSVAEHLYAYGFFVIEKLKRHSQAAVLMAQLLRSPRFKAEYAPSVLSMLANAQPEKLFLQILRVSQYLTRDEVRARAQAILQEIISTRTAEDLLASINDESFQDLRVNQAELLAFVKSVTIETPNALTRALLEDATSEGSQTISDVDGAIANAYIELSANDRWAWRDLTAGVRIHNLTIDPSRPGGVQVGAIWGAIRVREGEGVPA